MFKLSLTLFCIYINLFTLTLVAVSEPLSVDSYWPVFVSWTEAYEKSYDPTEMQDKFESFKENYDKVQLANAKNVKCNTVTFDDDDVNADIAPASISRKLQGVNDAASTMTITLPDNNIPTQSLNQFSDLSYGEFIDMYTGQEGGVETVAAAGGEALLSDGAISGIVIGGAIGSALLIGGAIYGVKKLKENKFKQQQIELEEKQQKEFETNIKKVFGGVNVFDLKPGSHQSITGRYPETVQQQ